MVVALASLAMGLGSACSGGSGTPSASGGANGSGSGGHASGGNGSGGNGSGSGGNASGGNGSGSGGKGSGGSGNGSGGNASGGNGSGSGGNGPGSGGSGSGGNASGSGGAAGSSSGGAAGGANGTSSGGAAGSANGGRSGGGAGATGQGGGGGPTGGGSGAACPSGAFFCSDFEGTGLPTGAKYWSSNDGDDWTKGTMLDTTVAHGGKQSIKFLKIASYSLREIQVPAAKKFWFRAYMRTDVAVGGSGGAMHNVFLEAMWSGGQQDKGAEVVEEDCELGMNITDTRFGSNGTKDQPGCPSADPKGSQLDANKWYCLEGSFDGGTGNFQLYVDEQKVLDRMAESKAMQSFMSLRFGYRHYHERQRTVWFDDVVTAPDRIYCLK